MKRACGRRAGRVCAGGHRCAAAGTALRGRVRLSHRCGGSCILKATEASEANGLLRALRRSADIAHAVPGCSFP